MSSVVAGNLCDASKTHETAKAWLPSDQAFVVRTNPSDRTQPTKHRPERFATSIYGSSNELRDEFKLFAKLERHMHIYDSCWNASTTQW
ncbi:hypothetical protein AB1K70_13140 [Bremerella sp. JC770]|uniref:hypothetical protein n=1 Tax=Bremerella sp. JC770 TaxID=3232137 RepID=UPI003457BB85